MKKEKVTINSEFKNFESLFELLKKNIVLGDEIEKSINSRKINELKKNTNKIKTLLKIWGIFGDKEDKKRLDNYYSLNYKNNLLKKCKLSKTNTTKYKCDVLKKRAIGKHLNFLKIIFEECDNQLKLVEKISDKPQKLYIKKLLLSISEFRGVMKFLPLDKAYKLHASRISVKDLEDFLKKIKTFSKKYSINTFAITEKSARLIGELLEESNISQKIIYYTPDPITREKVKNPQTIFKEEFPGLKIKNKNLLIVDEYIETGDTLKVSKKFFEKLGFQNVYTCTMYINETCKYSPNFFTKKTFLTPPWYDFPIMLREKVEGHFKTIPLKIDSGLLKSRLKRQKKNMISSLIKKIEI